MSDIENLLTCGYQYQSRSFCWMIAVRVFRRYVIHQEGEVGDFHNL